MWREKTFRLVASALCILLSVGTICDAGTDEAKAARIKAGMLYHLAALTQWPETHFEQATTPITVGVLGKDPHGLGDYFRSQSASVTAQGRHFVVLKLVWPIVEQGPAKPTPALKKALRACDVLLVTAAATPLLAQSLTALGSANVLTVGETEAFSMAGGMVALVVEHITVKIWVNMRALEEGGIKTSSEFLRHAQLVEGTHAATE
jgi:hypothetical protein